VSDPLGALEERKPFTFGELLVQPDGDEGWRVEPEGQSGEPREVAPDPELLRQLVRFDESGRYRPLSGARTLPRGWVVRAPDRHSLEAVLEAIYPLALVHLRQLREGKLRVVPLDEVLGRQSGRYAVARELSGEGRELVRRLLCGTCVRVPVWAGEEPAAEIPCPEACSVFVSFCREAALWERGEGAGGHDRSGEAAPEWADFEHPRNELRQAFLRLRGIVSARGAVR